MSRQTLKRSSEKRKGKNQNQICRSGIGYIFMSEAINEKRTSEARPTPPPSDGHLASGGALGLSYALEYVGFVNGGYFT